MTPAEQFAVNTYPHDTFPGEFGDSLRAACAVGFVAGQKENGLLKKVREMRDAQLEFDRTRITGWRYKVQRLGAEIDKTLKELGVETSTKKDIRAVTAPASDTASARFQIWSLAARY